jgi:alpha-ketoglutarate-dependent 2,4-dichlorophenoxyacetate dioxygenase
MEPDTDEGRTVEVRRIDGSFAGEVIGLDILADDLEDRAQALTDAIDEYGVLVVRDTAQDDDAFMRFAALFGEFQTSTKKPSAKGDTAQAYAVSNVNDQGEITDRQTRERALGLTARQWHTDHSFRRPSIKYTILGARTIPPEGGGTQFRDMRAAYDALSDELKDKIDDLRTVHDFERHHVIAGQQINEDDREALPPVEQPLVRTHPTTGRRSIYAGIHADHIEGLPVEEGRALLDELDRFADQERFYYTHQYRPGDIVMWDNRSVEHRQMPWDDTKYPRVIKRTAIADLDVPVGAATPV